MCVVFRIVFGFIGKSFLSIIFVIVVVLIFLVEFTIYVKIVESRVFLIGSGVSRL